MKIYTLKGRLTILFLVCVTSGCSYIKSLFPDKERDYQFRSEIPELIIPDDLKAHKLSAKAPVQAPAINVTENSIANAVAPRAIATEAATASSQAKNSSPQQVQPAAVSAETDKSAPAVTGSSLVIDQMQKQAWRLVARALMRQKIEIVERNMDQGYFYVKYDPDAIKPEDSSIWDEMMFLWGDDPSHENQYRVSLLEIAPLETEVTIQNIEGKTIADHSATALLKSITDGINNDIPSESSEPKSAKDSVPAPLETKGDGPLTMPAP